METGQEEEDLEKKKRKKPRDERTGRKEGAQLMDMDRMGCWGWEVVSMSIYVHMICIRRYDVMRREEKRREDMQLIPIDIPRSL